MDIDFGEGKDHKLRFEAPWDFDSTLGNKRFNIPDVGKYNNDCYNGGITEMFAGKAQSRLNGTGVKNGGGASGATHANPWMVMFVNQPWFKELVKDRWNNHINKTALKAELSSFIDANSSSQYEQVFNYTRQIWGNPGDKIDELCAASKAAALDSQAASAEYFKNWLTARIDAVDNIINNILQ